MNEYSLAKVQLFLFWSYEKSHRVFSFAFSCCKVSFYTKDVAYLTWKCKTFSGFIA